MRRRFDAGRDFSHSGARLMLFKLGQFRVFRGFGHCHDWTQQGESIQQKMWVHEK